MSAEPSAPVVTRAVGPAPTVPTRPWRFYETQVSPGLRLQCSVDRYMSGALYAVMFNEEVAVAGAKPRYASVGLNGDVVLASGALRADLRDALAAFTAEVERMEAEWLGESRTLMDTGLCCMARHANAVPPWTCDCPCHAREAKL